MSSLSKSNQKSVSTTDRVEMRWDIEIYTHILAITHGGRLVKVQISKPGMSLDFSCAEGSNKLFDEAIQYLINVKHEIPLETEYKKVS